ncbi:cupin domain-containing protein [Chloroflexi bacterium TSY]|nr:cupin domain-containing protein [Chloroflexi bacterium TSY]
MRRIVTGYSNEGKSIIIKDGEPPRVLKREEAPGVEVHEIWATHEPIPSHPIDNMEPTIEGWSYWPQAGASIFRIVRYPPLSEIEKALEAGIDVVPAWRECLAKSRGLEIPTEHKGAGLHVTATIDYAIVLSGEIWMTLDDDVQVHLKAGDCVIQNGTRHSWCNQTDEPCFIAFTLIGTGERHPVKVDASY